MAVIVWVEVLVKVIVDVFVNVPVFGLMIVWMIVCPSPLDVKVLVCVFELVWMTVLAMVRVVVSTDVWVNVPVDSLTVGGSARRGTWPAQAGRELCNRAIPARVPNARRTLSLVIMIQEFGASLRWAF